jgi:hypothetical protein
MAAILLVAILVPRRVQRSSWVAFFIRKRNSLRRQRRWVLISVAAISCFRRPIWINLSNVQTKNSQGRRCPVPILPALRDPCTGIACAATRPLRDGAAQTIGVGLAAFSPASGGSSSSRRSSIAVTQCRSGSLCSAAPRQALAQRRRACCGLNRWRSKSRFSRSAHTSCAGSGNRLRSERLKPINVVQVAAKLTTVSAPMRRRTYFLGATSRRRLQTA